MDTGILLRSFSIGVYGRDRQGMVFHGLLDLCKIDRFLIEMYARDFFIFVELGLLAEILRNYGENKTAIYK